MDYKRTENAQIFGGCGHKTQLTAMRRATMEWTITEWGSKEKGNIAVWW